LLLFQQALGSEVVVSTSEKLPLNSDRTLTKKFASPKIYKITSYAIIGIVGVGIVLGIAMKLITQPTQPQKTSPTVQPTLTTDLNTDKDTTTTNQFEASLIFWALLLLLVPFSGVCVLLKLAGKEPIGDSISLAKKSSTNQIIVAPQAELIQTDKDEVQAVKSVLQASSIHLSGEFFPVTQRQMKQTWRYLRRRTREGKAIELDVEATIKHIGNEGMLIKPVLIPAKVNRAELLLLIDQDGSMVPFHALSQGLAETALGAGRLGKIGIYYFHNCPVEYLYRDSYHQQGELVSDIVTHVCSKRTAVLIFSDAGAARGGYSKKRYQLTQEFLTQLQQKVRYIAWLNPMPKQRWLGNTADEISSLVPMFEVSRKGLQDVISVLSGRPANF
jgi:hypothetical protein